MALARHVLEQWYLQLGDWDKYLRKQLILQSQQAMVLLSHFVQGPQLQMWNSFNFIQQSYGSARVLKVNNLSLVKHFAVKVLTWLITTVIDL
jgi:hypothetical protein